MQESSVSEYPLVSGVSGVLQHFGFIFWG